MRRVPRPLCRSIPALAPTRRAGSGSTTSRSSVGGRMRGRLGVARVGLDLRRYCELERRERTFGPIEGMFSRWGYKERRLGGSSQNRSRGFWSILRPSRAFFAGITQPESLAFLGCDNWTAACVRRDAPPRTPYRYRLRFAQRFVHLPTAGQ